jgi:hypothetical protein
MAGEAAEKVAADPTLSIISAGGLVGSILGLIAAFCCTKTKPPNEQVRRADLDWHRPLLHQYAIDWHRPLLHQYAID